MPVYQTLICITTIDSSIAVKYNFHHRCIVTKCRSYAPLPAIWVLSASLAVLYALTSIKVYYVMWITLDIFTAATLVMCYLYIMITMHRQKRIFKRNSSCRSQFKYEIPLGTCLTYLIPIKIRVPLNFAPLISAHPQISRPFNFRPPLFYCEFAIFFAHCSILSCPFNFRAFVLRELAPFNFSAG